MPFRISWKPDNTEVYILWLEGPMCNYGYFRVHGFA
jgi:hypothetical protein